jgi:hypothetical protein
MEPTMPLTFPTIAEQVVAEFRAATVTVSISTIARKHNGSRAVGNTGEKIKRWTFDDDSSLETTGQGRAWKATTFCP